MMPWSAVRRTCCLYVVHVYVLISWTTCWGFAQNGPMKTGSFEGVESIRVVQCDGVGNNVKGLKITEGRNESKALVSAGDKNLELVCTTNSSFSACTVQRGGSAKNISVRVILTDLEPGEVREYTCVILRETGDTIGSTVPHHHHINVTRPEVTTTTTESPPTTVAEDETPKTDMSSSNTDDVPVFGAAAVYVILVLLIVMAVFCAVLAVFYWRNQRRKRRSRDCDVMSIRSGVTDKSFYAADPLTCRGFVQQVDTLPRQFAPAHSPDPSYPPPANKGGPALGANRHVMHYQKPSDSLSVGGVHPAADRSFMSESMVHYHEPWGGRVLDDPEILGKLSTLRSPNRHLVQVPNFDAASSGLIASQAQPTFVDTPPPIPEAPPPPSLAVTDDASETIICPPTQEMGPALGEESV